MPGSSYRLCGFASGVDCRAVHFKDPLPPARICGLCGFVPDKIALLPCSHLLCESCLQGCADGDVCGCPMDETTFQVDADISWITPPRHHLSKLQVFCWNMENGCDFVGPAEKLLEHFEKECSFHAITCPRCHDAVLRKDVPQHCKEGCSALPSPPPPGAAREEAASSRDGALPLDNVPSPHQDCLASIEAGVNNLVEAVNKMGVELSRSTEHREAGVVEEKLQEVVQTLCDLFQNTQRASSSASFPANIVERPTFGTLTELVSTGPAENLLVLVYSYYWDNWPHMGTGTVDTYTPIIRGEVTNVEIQFWKPHKAAFACVSAKLTKPGRWCLPDIEPLPSSHVCALSLEDVIYRGALAVPNIDIYLRQGHFLRCIRELPPPYFDSDPCKKPLIFLVKMKLSDNSNS
ncbi:uncharacterized protein LOC144158954 isoform X2 [Haemaphysalis longicornis]